MDVNINPGLPTSHIPSNVYSGCPKSLLHPYKVIILLKLDKTSCACSLLTRIHTADRIMVPSISLLRWGVPLASGSACLLLECWTWSSKLAKFSNVNLSKRKNNFLKTGVVKAGILRIARDMVLQYFNVSKGCIKKKIVIIAVKYSLCFNV